MAIEFLNSAAFEAAKLPFSQAVRVGDVLYLSGAIGNLPGQLELVRGGIEAETRQTMENIDATLRENGRSFDDVFKCTVMLADMSKWADFNRIYVQVLQAGPASLTFGFRRRRAGAGGAGRARVLGPCAKKVITS